MFPSLEEKYHDADYWTAKLQLELFRLIKQHLEDTGMSQNALARQIGVSKGYLSQVLNGNFDHKLSKLVSLALAVGKLPLIEYEDVDKVVRMARGEYEPLRASYVSAPQQVWAAPPATAASQARNQEEVTSLIFNQAS
ncbi:MAG: helix-turn-helix transcriptional regulator [Bacteroidota bacterium]